MGMKAWGAAIFALTAAAGGARSAQASEIYDVGVMITCPYSCGSYSSASAGEGNYTPGDDFGGAEEGGQVGGDHAAWGRLRNARADYGDLGVAAAAYDYETGDGRPVVMVGGTATARFVDLVKVESDTLPIGTPVTITRSFEVSAISPGPGWNNNFALDGVGGDGTYDIATAGGLFSLNGTDYRLAPGVGISNVVLTIPTFVGSYYTLDATLTAEALIYRPYTYASGMVSVGFYAYHSAHVYLESDDPAVTLSSVSGHDYSLPPVVSGAPEPTTWALMLMGFGLAGWRVRRSGPSPRRAA